MNRGADVCARVRDVGVIAVGKANASANADAGDAERTATATAAADATMKLGGRRRCIIVVFLGSCRPS